MCEKERVTFMFPDDFALADGYVVICAGWLVHCWEWSVANLNARKTGAYADVTRSRHSGRLHYATFLTASYCSRDITQSFLSAKLRWKLHAIGFRTRDVSSEVDSKNSTRSCIPVTSHCCRERSSVMTSAWLKWNRLHKLRAPLNPLKPWSDLQHWANVYGEKKTSITKTEFQSIWSTKVFGLNKNFVTWTVVRFLHSRTSITWTENCSASY